MEEIGICRVTDDDTLDFSEVYCQGCFREIQATIDIGAYRSLSQSNFGQMGLRKPVVCSRCKDRVIWSPAGETL